MRQSMDELEQQVRDVIAKVARQRGAVPASIEGHHRLTLDLGLKSLDLAQIVALLERHTGVDPFAELVAITSVRTVADLCGAYRRCLAGEAAPASERAAGRERAARRLASRVRRAGAADPATGGSADG
jgi:acyl carrier protein